MAQDQNRNIVAAISYLLFFITGVVILLVEQEDKFIRFHAMQSAILFGFIFVANFIIGLLLGEAALLANIINTLIWLVIIIVWLSSMIRAYQGKIFKWPVVGNFVEKQVGK